MRVTVIGDLNNLERDLRELPAKSAKDMQATVREGVKVGNVVARDYARQSAGSHGKHYPRAFSSETARPFFGFGVAIFSGEYGPDISKPQGGMSFEGGSRNQKPHRDLAKSQDVIGPAFYGEVRRLPDRWFWS